MNVFGICIEITAQNIAVVISEFKVIAAVRRAHCAAAGFGAAYGCGVYTTLGVSQPAYALRQCGKHAAMRRTHYGHFKRLVAFYAAEHIGYGHKRRIRCGGIIVAECPKWIKLKRGGFGCRLGRFTLLCRRGRYGRGRWRRQGTMRGCCCGRWRG